jgi:hypothetical protein
LWKKPQRRARRVNLNNTPRLRWFVLRESSLAYYIYSEEEQKIGKLKGYIPMEKIQSVQAHTSDDADGSRCFEVCV